MRIATYNINSVRLRINRVLQLLNDEQIDVLCLQETKAEDHVFPTKKLAEAGWEHIAASGEKSYNGVAIISRIPFTTTEAIPFVNGQKRHISATFEDGTTIHNFYVPAGGDEPDVEINPKFKHKLDYLTAMREHFASHEKSSKQVLVGDLNIAPFEHDVWSHKQLLKVVSHTPVEVEMLQTVYDSLGWIDVARHFVPEPEKLYSWWSYRNRDWQKSNRGRRLDHIWVTPSLTDKLEQIRFLPDWRNPVTTCEKPSDHVPVVMDIAL